jgi:hypothetical protein
MSLDSLLHVLSGTDNKKTLTKSGHSLLWTPGDASGINNLEISFPGGDLIQDTPEKEVHLRRNSPLIGHIHRLPYLHVELSFLHLPVQETYNKAIRSMNLGSLIHVPLVIDRVEIVMKRQHPPSGASGEPSRITNFETHLDG